ncbi:bifunctional NAD(P)/FAD-dependent oxidoreductase/class I SAM-dependent methyltransferase [Nonomuraea sp. NPDC049152]|uniref:bifunctional NAD(P)/FAD-dependent oxidoreductase/class I SAM-dependent methyltransferase n=1 Tax=Nonomuraea sp. NPDC049152 TaxID=3154350 RepID=UPI0033E25E38
MTTHTEHIGTAQGASPGSGSDERAERRYDVVVVGGGAAGLSGALTLARARRSVLVIDAGRPRNAPAAHVHTYLTREGMPPAQLLAEGRAEVIGYGGEIVNGTVVTAERMDAGGFRVVLDDGSAVAAERLLVTTGLVDELPDVPGLAERFGRDVLHCPYCHGWEVRDQRIGVLATGPLAVHQALMWRQWSADVTLFLHTTEGLGEDEQLSARGITVVAGQVAELKVKDDALTGVRLADGAVVPCQALVVAARLTARVIPGLGLEPVDQETGGHVIGSHIPADPSGATAVPGVWVAGNVTSLVEQVIGAAGAGVRAGAAINADLIAEETRRAVAAARHSSDETFWDARYDQSDRVWSGKPNDILVREVTGMEPGRALDLGCGEGGDAIWLARRGWRVTGVDISGVALDRAASQAAAEGVAALVEWERRDLGESFPEGTFDLVSTHFLHSFTEMPRERILRRAVSAVAPGGVLLIVGHSDTGPWHHDSELRLPKPEEVLSSLELPEGRWEVQLCEEHERIQTGPDGRPASRTDNVVRVRRLPG